MTLGLGARGLWLVLGALLGACGSINNGGGGGGGDGIGGAGGSDAGTEAVLTIENFTFNPKNLLVSPGTRVRVVNRDSAPHSVTSESMDGVLTPGSVNGVSFDTGPFTGERTFMVPAGAPHGTVVPYYCTVHLSGMRNNGHITVQ